MIEKKTTGEIWLEYETYIENLDNDKIWISEDNHKCELNIILNKVNSAINLSKGFDCNCYSSLLAIREHILNLLKELESVKE